MERYTTCNGPSLLDFMLSQFHEIGGQKIRVMFGLHTYDEQGDGICFDFTCTIESSERTDEEGNWKFTAKGYWEQPIGTPKLQFVRGEYSTKTRRGWMDVGTAEEFESKLEVVTKPMTAEHWARVEVYLNGEKVKIVGTKAIIAEGGRYAFVEFHDVPVE